MVSVGNWSSCLDIVHSCKSFVLQQEMYKDQLWLQIRRDNVFIHRNSHSPVELSKHPEQPPIV